MSIRPRTNSYQSEIEFEACGCQISKNRRLLLPHLQYFAKPKFALVFFCFVSIVQGFVLSGLYSVVVSTIEKRFQLRSTETGLIAGSGYFSSCLSVLFVAYIGGKAHKPMWIGWGVFLVGIGTITFSLPHFFAPPYKHGNDVYNVCNATIMPSECMESNLRRYIGLFIVAMLLCGIGSTTVSILGITYLDENVPQVKSSLYHGIYFASGTVGPALGFLFGGRFLTLYTNIFEKVNIDESSSQWIGAWWLGYLIGGAIILVLSIPIALLPRQLPNNCDVMLSRDRTNSPEHDIVFSSRSHKVVRIVIDLLRNPTFSLVTLAACFASSVVNGVSTFGVKYMQSMYYLSASQAAIYFGSLAIFAGAVGQILGGVVVTKLKLNVAGILKFCGACITISALCSLIFFKSCPNVAFAGATFNYTAPGTTYLDSDFNSTCYLPCHCNTDSYAPVCGEDNITYYSPCFAGCHTKNGSEYANCSCILTYSFNRGGSAMDGKCSPKSCGGFPLFFIFFSIVIFFTFMIISPAMQVTLRVVPFNQRSLAIGVKSVVVSLFGSIPGPIIFGRVLDRACVVWSTECGKQGTCELYDNTNLAANMATFILTSKIFIVLVFGIAWWTCKPQWKETLEGREEYNLLNNSTMPDVDYSILNTDVNNLHYDNTE